MSNVNYGIVLILFILAVITLAGTANARTVEAQTVTFQLPNYPVAENGGTVTLYLHLSNIPASAVVVSYTTKDYTAFSGKNYTAISDSVTIPAGCQDAPINIQIKDNYIYDPASRSFFVNITGVTGDLGEYTVPAGANATVNIVENDPEPVIEFASSVVWTDEGKPAYLPMVKVSNGDGQFIPMGIAVNDKSGIVYIADFFNHRIQAFYPNGSFAFKFGTYGSGLGQLMDPYCLAIDQVNGKVYVTDLTGRVMVFDDQGNNPSEIDGLSYPRGIAISPFNGNIYITESYGISEYTSTGAFVKSINSYDDPESHTNWLDALIGVAIKSNGNVLVTDTIGNLTIEFDPDLNYRTRFTTPSPALNGPQGIAMGSEGNFYVVDNKNDRVVTYDSDDQATGMNFGSDRMSSPFMIAVDNNLGRIYVTDPSIARVECFDLNRNYVKSWGGPYTTVPVSINCVTKNGTAISGTNYVATNSVVTFQPNEYFINSYVPTIMVPQYKPDQYFFVNLSNPVNAQPGSLFQGETIWVCNTYPPSVQFNQSSYAVWENATSVVLNLTLLAPVSTDVKITYSTHDGTAKAGVNYTSVSSTATILAGQTHVLINVPIVDDNKYGGDTFFFVNLTSVTSGNAIIGSQDRTQVNVKDDEMTFTINLKKGWNLISSPIVLSGLKASDLDGTGVTMVANYYPLSNSYVIFQEGWDDAGSANDFPITTDVGYFVAADQDMKLTFSGHLSVARSVDITKTNTWGLYGWSTLDSASASQFASLVVGTQMIAKYNAQQNKFTIYQEGWTEPTDPENFNLVPGEGYFITSDTSTTINYGGI